MSDYVFTYTGQDDEELRAHDGQRCSIVHELGDDVRDVEVGPMFHVRFDDDFECDVFIEELSPEPLSNLLRLNLEREWEKIDGCS